MKLAVAAILAFAAFAICKAQDTGYRVKAVLVRSAEKRMEGKFLQVPDDMRIVCEGDTSGISEGDYVKIEFKGKRIVAGKLTCTSIGWYH